jgi:hypothetical protein
MWSRRLGEDVLYASGWWSGRLQSRGLCRSARSRGSLGWARLRCSVARGDGRFLRRQRSGRASGLPSCARCTRHMGERRYVWDRLDAQRGRSRPRFQAIRVGRPLGLRGRLSLDERLRVGVGAISLWPVGRSGATWMVLDPRPRVRPRLGRMEDGRRVRGLVAREPPLFIWRGGIAVTAGFGPPPPRFVFCAHADLFAPAPARIVIMGPRAVEIERQTYVYAAPGGHEHFHHGPPLASLHVPPERIVHATGHEHGCERARAFAQPSTCVRLGAHPPTRHLSPEPMAPSHDSPRHTEESPHGDSHPEMHRPTEHPVAPPGHNHAPPPHSAPPESAPPRRRK